METLVDLHPEKIPDVEVQAFKIRTIWSDKMLGIEE